jgi:hypothetical protein
MNTNKSNEIAIAKTIADTLGVDSSGSSPEMMVNNALRNARKNSMMLRGESMKIIMRMLELAKSVGIKYDENIIKVPEVNEDIKGWKNAGSDITRMRKARADETKTVHLHRLKKDGSESGMHDSRKAFSSREDAQSHHDNSRKLNPKSDIRHNLYIDGKHVETLKESASRFIEKVRAAEKSVATGNHKNAKMHLDTARSFMYGVKSTDASKISSTHASYTKMRAEYEGKIEESFTVKNSKGAVVHTAYSENAAKQKVAELSKTGEKHTSGYDREAMVKEDLDEAHKIGSSVEVIGGPAKGKRGTVGEIRHGAFKGAPKTYTVYHGENDAVQVKKEHIRSIKESEALDELSTEKLAAYKRKASLAASEADKKGDFKTGDKRFSGIMKATRKQFDNGLKEGSDICVSHESGKKVYGKIKGKHGSVVEVIYKNGKVGFHHNHKVALLNELDPVQESTVKTYADLLSEMHPSVETERRLKVAVKHSAGEYTKEELEDLQVELAQTSGEGESEADLNKRVHAKPGNSLGARNDTVRKMMVDKIRH